MSEEKTPLEPLQKGTHLAGTVQNAVKIGKALSSTAKGAAAGGPYGAIAGLLWENRELVTKILISAIVLLLLPVIMLCMLPGLAFADPADNAPNAAIQDDTALIANMVTIYTAIDAILTESLHTTLAAVEEDFSASPAVGKEIFNPYAENRAFNVYLCIGQYCAYRNADPASISLTDMEAILRQHTDQLYTYTKLLDTRTQTTTTDGASAVTEEWILYTVVYNGEAYMADEVYRLSDDQKQLAKNYAQNLELYLNYG